MQIVKVNAKVLQDNTGICIEIPVLLDENKEIIKPFLEFILKLKRDGKSQSTISNYTRATQLLLEYMAALMCAEKTGGFNLVNYRHSSGVYHEQETEDLHRRI